MRDEIQSQDMGFRLTVRAMRTAQRMYFASRRRDYLILAKQYEKEVDDYLQTLENGDDDVKMEPGH